MLGIISHIKRVRDNSSSCKEVIDQICSLSKVLRAATESVNDQVSVRAIPAALAEARFGSSTELVNRIQKLQSRLDAVNLSAEKLQKQSRVARVVLANRNSDILKSMAESIKQSQDEFMFIGQIAIEIVLQVVAAQMKATAERQEAESSATAERSRIEELKSALDQLPYAEASYKASVHARHATLLEGTRTEILAEIDAWRSCETEQQNRPFFVLRGGAGTGKSTIAFEVARRAESAGHFGASFFFMRGSARLNTAESVFPTLARQLIHNLPQLQATALPHVLAHLKHGAHQNVDQQAKDLFTGLLSSLPSSHPPILIVVDAVDECTESAQDLVCRMLFLMMGAVSDMPCPIRVFITSRPEVHLEDAFDSPMFSSAQKYVLHDIPRAIVDRDIRLYFSTRLSELPDAHRRVFSELYPDAPDDLTELAAGLFIYATTAFEFLRQCRGGIARGMAQLMASRDTAVQAPLDRLDQLYSIVLGMAFHAGTVSVPRASVMEILGSVVLLQEHLSPQNLALLTGRSLHSEVLPVVERLGAVVSVQAKSPEAPMQLLHASFAEYLVDRERSGQSGFYVDEAMQHASLAVHCLSLLLRPRTLIRNICQLPDPTVPKNEVTDLVTRIRTHLPGPIQYSCSHWLAHVAYSGGSPTIQDALVRFCISSPRLLEWLEALAFLDSVDHAIHMLPVVCSIYPPSRDPGSVGNILYDVFRIALDFSPAVKACPNQLYVSALPLTPAESRLRVLYAGVLQAPGTLACPARFLETWIPWHDTEPSGPHGSSTSGIKFTCFAPHGRWLAVFGGPDCAIHLCQPVTGDIIQSIMGHSSPVLHLHFSSNGLRMVSTSEGCILVHSTRSGTVLRSFTVNGLASRAYFVLEDSAVLLQFLRKEVVRVALWQPSTDNVTFLDELHPDLGRVSLSISDVSSTGRWAMVVHKKFLGLFDVVYVGLVLDLTFGLSFGSVISQFTQTSAAACFVPGTETLVVARESSLDVCDVTTADVLRTVPIDGANRQVVSIVASRRSQHIVALVGSVASPDSIQVHPAEGPHLTLPAADVTGVALSPDGRYIVGVLKSGYAWRTMDLVGNAPAGTDADGGRGAALFTVAISDDLGTVAVANTESAMYFRIASGERRTVPASQDLRRLGMLEHPVRLSLSPDGRAACMVLEHHVALLGAGEPRLLGLTDARLRAFNADAVPDVFSANWVLESGDFSSDGTCLFALVRVQYRHGKYGEGVWQARQLVCWDLTPGVDNSEEPVLRLHHLDTVSGVGPVIRSGISALGVLHFAVAQQKEPGVGGLLHYAVRLPQHNDFLESDARSLVASETAGIPGEIYSLSVDGWIRRASDDTRNLYWVPPSRRPRGDRFESAVAAQGHLIALVSDTGLLTVVDMSACETRG